MDIMVLKAQQWMNSTYGEDSRYTPVVEDGLTGWGTINGLILALQIELGIEETAEVFGPTTRSLFNTRFPNGIVAQSNEDETTDNIYSIVQCALWCKGYYAESGAITGHYRGQSAASIIELKNDMGLTDNTSTITVNIMDALLSMKQYVLVPGGSSTIRNIQQELNASYEAYIGLIPCDGYYGREMNIGLIKVLQAIEGFTPDEATGNFGEGTKSRCPVVPWTVDPSTVKLLKYALCCNGFETDNLSGYWTYETEERVIEFQTEYCLDADGIVGLSTWMSLLLSCGNPDRAAIACDTRFEITDALAQRLVADGYQIVGRYLTGGDFKEIREGELERILSYGLKYFPIFQHDGTEESNFTYETGKEHAELARRAAIEHKVPSTVIYFAVDFDAMDYQVTSNILPYFRGVSEHIGPLYKVGIYAPRNVCSRVCDAGYAVSSFVSDMSTGFSGNLGFPIPANWNYDQFHEISGYGGSWDLDKVAYSGRIPACDSVDDHAIEGYVMPPDPDTTTIEHNIFEVIDIIREVESAYEEYRNGGFANYPVDPVPALQETPYGVLNYIAKRYTVDPLFDAAVQPFDTAFEQFMIVEHPSLHAEVSSYFFVGNEDREVSDIKYRTDDDGNEVIVNNNKGIIDVAHLAYSILAYVTHSLTFDHWASWGGDLASGMDSISKYLANNSSENIQAVANMLIGTSNEDLASRCNYTDLCDDADAIGISRIMESNSIYTHLLSDSMVEYYDNLSPVKRYSQYQYDLLSFNTLDSLYSSLCDQVYVGIISPLDILKKYASIDVEKAACKAFANYIWTKIK